MRTLTVGFAYLRSAEGAQVDWGVLMAGSLERFTIEMAFICASEDKAGKEQKRSHSGLRRVFVTQAADAATSRWATDQT